MNFHDQGLHLHLIMSLLCVCVCVREGVFGLTIHLGKKQTVKAVPCINELHTEDYHRVQEVRVHNTREYPLLICWFEKNNM